MAEHPVLAVKTPSGVHVSFGITVNKLHDLRFHKQATFGRFVIDCDEGPNVGGDETAPPPLAYFAASYAF